jgi:heme/copper-type cytochrome/quinol oxidase subunit 3
VSATASLSLPGRTPQLPSGVIAMAIFIATEVMLFAGLVSSLLVLRAQAPDWPPLDQPRLPVGVTGLNSAVLLASGLALQVGARALRAGAAPGRWLALTIALGALFLIVQGGEWVRLIHYGLTASSSLYGATFYTIVGAHAVHAAAGLVALAVGARRAARASGAREAALAFEPVRMFWTFVVVLWPILYGLVYF